MDITLYSLLVNKLKKIDECLTWNGFRIEIVDAIPEVQAPNTIYFVKSDQAVVISQDDSGSDE